MKEVVDRINKTLEESDLEDFDLVRKEGKEYTVIDKTFEGERRTIQGKDGNTHVGRVRIKKVYCGKKCKKCPHPIYAYLNYRDGKRTSEKYLGKIG